MSKNPFEDPNFGAPATSGKPAPNPFNDPEFGKEPPSRGVTGWARDLGAWGLKGAIGIPEAAVGVADLITGGKAGKALENEGGSFGLRFKQAKEVANDLHSDTYKAKQQDFQNAEGVLGKAKVALTNPDLVVGAVAESLPSMIAGGGVGRGLMAATRLGQIGAKGAAIAGAAGEGVVGAGSAVEQIRQQTDDGLLTGKQAGLAAATGLVTGALGFAGNKVANKLGVGDADMMLAQGTKGMAKDAAERATAAAVNPLAAPAQKSILRQMGEGAIAEGVLEELPQSVSEQVLQNEALGKTWSEGLDEAVVMGILSGGAMGAGAAGYRGFKDKQISDAAKAQQGASAAQAAPGAATPQPADPNWTTSAGAADPAAQQAGTAPASPANAPNLGYETLPGAAPQSFGNEVDFKRDFETPQWDTQLGAGIDGQPAPAGNAAPKAPNWELTPSQAMGLDAKAGGLTAAAALAVDSGASPVVQPQAAPVAEQTPVLQQSAPQVPAGVDPDTGEVSLQAQMDEIKGRIAFMQQQGAAQGWNKDMVAQRNALQSQLTKLEVQSAKENKQGASTTGAPAPVKLTGITQILAKQIPDMSAGELEQAIAHYGPNHKRTKKLEKALQALAQKPVVDIETGAKTDGTQTPQAQQGSPQPAQAGAAQASAPAVQGVSANASPAQYDGTQASAPTAAKSQAPSTQAAPAKQVNAAEAIAKEGNAQREQERQRLLDASERWTRMTGMERQAMAQGLKTMNVLTRKNVHTRAWADLSDKVRGQLADAIEASFQPVAQENKAPAAIESEAKSALKTDAKQEAPPVSRESALNDRLIKASADAMASDATYADGPVGLMGLQRSSQARIGVLNDELKAATNDADRASVQKKLDSERKNFEGITQEIAKYKQDNQPAPKRMQAAKDSAAPATAEQYKGKDADKFGPAIAAVREHTDGRIDKASLIERLRPLGLTDAQVQSVTYKLGDEFSMDDVRAVLSKDVQPSDEKPFAAETGTLGIPRADMPQVPTANHGGLVKHLNAKGIAHETKTVDAADLKPTQAEYSPSKVEAAKSATGDRAVIVSSDGHIIDGHHQAVAAAEEGKPVKAIVLDAPVEKALEAVKASPSANLMQAAKDSGKQDLAYTLPEGSISDDWRDDNKRAVEHPEYKPSPRQQRLMDEVKKALDGGAFYNDDLVDKVAQALGVSDEVKASNRTGVQNGDFGYDVYHARKAVEAQAQEADAAKIRAELNLQPGDKLGTLIFNDFKQTNSVEVVSISEDGRRASFKGKRGAATATFEATIPTVKFAIERAHEKGKRKDSYEEFIAGRAAEKEGVTQTIATTPAARFEQLRAKGKAEYRANDREQAPFKAFGAVAGATGEAYTTVWSRWNSVMGFKDSVEKETGEQVAAKMQAQLLKAPWANEAVYPGDGRGMAADASLQLWRNRADKVNKQAESFARELDREELRARDAENFGVPDEAVSKARAAVSEMRKRAAQAVQETKDGLAQAEERTKAEAAAEAKAYQDTFEAPSQSVLAKKPTPASITSWSKPTELRGQNFYTNGHFVDATGTPPHIKDWESRIGIRVDIPASQMERVLGLAGVRNGEMDNTHVKAEPLALINDKKQGRMFFDVGGKLVAIDLTYAQYFVSKIKGATFTANPNDLSGALRVMDGDKLAGIVMPIRMGADAPSVEDVRGYMKASGKDKPQSVVARKQAEQQAAASGQDFPMTEAVQSYNGISHSGRTRAEQDKQAFDKFMKAAEAAGDSLAETDAQRTALSAAVDQLHADYLAQYRSLMNVRAGTYSGYVAGRGNLNSKQANARNSALDKAMERFDNWVGDNVDRVSKAVMAARTPEQVKADQDKVMADIEARAAKKADGIKEQLLKFLSFKSGDNLSYGKNFAITKVSYDKDGYPSSLTFKSLDGSPLSDDKININEALKDKGETLAQSKARIRALVDEVRAENPQLTKGAGAIRAAASSRAEKVTPEPEMNAGEASYLDRHNAIEDGISAGTLSLDGYKSAFAELDGNRDEVLAELQKLTKAQMLKAGGPMFAYRMRDDKKDAIVLAAYQSMLDTYALGRSYGPSSYFLSADSIAKNKAEKAQALRELVANTTAEDMAARAAEIKAARDEFKAKREAQAEALANPKTLQDFRAFMRHWMEKGETSEAAYVRLTPEQRQQFDALEAEQTKDSRDAAKRRAQVAVASAGNTTAGEVIATKHTKHGHDLFVVQLAERVERDDYETLNSSAKRLGGSYSSYRGNGAVPGFQFRTREAAEAFQKLVGGDTAQAQELANQRRDAFDDDKSQSAAERLHTMADALDERATEAMGADRKVNTARRARFAASAEAAARTQQALAGTMRNIAQAIDSGAAKFLDGVRQRVQVEYLMGQLRTAKSNQLQAKYPDYGERMKRQGEPMDAETVDFAQFPRFEMYRSDLASLARQLLEIDGGKKMGAALEKLADDVSEAYIAWAKENLLRVSHFGNKADGGFAEFASKDVAERAIKRAGLVGKAVVLPVKRGQNRVILSPGEAMQRGLWQGDGDKRIRLKMEFVEELAKLGKRKGSKVLALPWQLESALENRQRLQRMGIQTPAEFRSALRELASLQQEMATPDRIKELERSMVGRANDGLDFFPTSQAVVQSMLDAAEIQEGMAVLEPSAGMGHIADAIVEETGVWPDVVELSGDRRELLEAKGFHLAEVNDFLNMEPRRFFTYGDTFRAPDGVEGIMRGVGGMGSQRVRLEDAEGNRISSYYDRSDLVPVAQNGSWSGYDRIIMNPPFSDGRDIKHVLHAYNLLRPGGRIVAIMGEGAFFHSNKRAEAFREWLDERGATSEKLPDGSFMDPSLPVNTGVAARMVVIDKPEGDHQLAPRDDDATADYAGAAQRRPASAQDKAVMQAIAQGKSARDVLRVVASGSKDPFMRQVARLLLKAGITPNIQFGHIGKSNGNPIHGQYRGKSDTIAIAGSAEYAAERIFMHEAMHAATMRALAKPGLPKLQLQKLLEHVRKQKGAAGFYGTKNVDEFVAEVFTNPDFQKALRTMSAPAASPLKSAWDGFVRILRSILGLPNDSTNALSQALALGVEAVRQDMVLRKQGMGTDRAANAESLSQTDMPAFKRWFGDSKVVDTDGKPLVVYHGTDKDISEFKPSNGGSLGDGIYFTDSADAAYRFAERKGDQMNIVAAYIQASSLLDVDNMTQAQIAKMKAAIPKDAAELMALGYPKTLAESAKDFINRDLAKIHSNPGFNPKSLALAVEGGSHSVLTAIYKKAGFDGITRISDGLIGRKPFREYLVFHSVQVKSATGNNGNFDPEDPSILNFGADDFTKLKTSALDQLNKTFTHEGKVSLWDKSVGTMRNLAERAPAFKPVYEAASQNIDDVSMLANDAADMAPRILPRVETLSDLKKKPVSAEDNKAVAKPLFEGTLIWARDENGKATLVDDLQKRYANLSAHNKAAMLLKQGKIDAGTLAMWQGQPVEQYEKLIDSRFESKFLKPGIVWTDAELRQQFNATDNQISLYREARAAIDRSIDMTARTDMLRVVGEDYESMREAVLGQSDVNGAAQLLLDTLQDEAKANPDAADRLGMYMQQIKNRAETAADLQDKGYAPLSRFGRYTVDVVDANGERQYFGMYESQRESNIAALQLAQEFKGATITKGTMSAEAYKLFAGVTPETLEQFGEMLGLKAEGNEAQDKAFQEFLKLTKNNHSAMKRLIHRKGIAGFREDVGRVVANFVYSNARAGAMGLNAGKMDKAIGAIPKEQGELKDLAVGLRSYIRDPQEEGQAVRGMLFAQYLGGSVASAFVNTTQPFAVTLPWLSQYGGMKKASQQLGKALNDMRRSWMDKSFSYEADLAKALQSAEDDGVVSPQEIHQLMAQARGAGMLRSGDGTKAGNLRAQAGNKWEQAKVLWGQPFALAEQFNRRSTFIAAYRTAKDQGIANPAEFARNAVIETQFQYSKANKPRWARGAVGGTLFTFKTYSVSYLELMNRMWTQGGPEGKRAVGWALAMLLLMSGAGGVPFMEDAEDLIDGAGQLMGYNISAKQWRKELLADVVGKELAEFMEQGLSGLPVAPVDVSGRLGMGNLLPGTGLFLNKPNRERDLMEIVGPAGDLVSRGFTGARKLLGGDVAGAALEVSPTAVRNLAKGADMAATGMYRDTKGYKVIDTTLAEAAAKAIGFQPKSVAEVQEANSFMQRSKSFYTQTSSEIKAQWADALFRKDEAAVQRVRERLADWNRDNPDQLIVVRMPDVWKRVREMGKDRSDRIADTAPKALRAQMREEVAALRG